jgi:outer membrane protein TolC
MRTALSGHARAPFRALAVASLPVLAAGAVATVARTASALEPLATYLEASKHANLDNREAAHQLAQSVEQARVATGALLPSFNAQGKLTRNQYDVAFQLEAGQPPLAVSPTNQWDAFFTLNVPIVDFRNFARSDSAHLTADAEQRSAQATELEVEQQVVIAYVQFAESLYLIGSERAALAAAQENSRIAQAQRAAGAAAEVDVQQALAEVATDEQNVATAELQRELLRRKLATLTGIAPKDDGVPENFPRFEALNEEAPLSDWEQRGGDTPTAAAQKLRVQAADASARAAKLALIPSLSAVATEHITNADAFTLGHEAAYAFGAALNWNLDFALSPTVGVQREARAIAEVQQDRTRLAIGDQIHQAWWTVHTDIVSVRAAIARSQAAHLVADLARDRYQKGVGTQLEAIQALRDATAADVGRIQADGGLAAARAVLRLATGVSLLSKESNGFSATSPAP